MHQYYQYHPYQSVYRYHINIRNMNIRSILKNFGLNEKEIAVYLALVELGPSPVRTVSAKTGVNRGTSYDILKSLIEQGIVAYYNKQTKQYFAAESPEKLLSALEAKEQQLEEVKQQIKDSMPELKGLFEKEGGRPIVKLYEGGTGIRFILEDVLQTMKRASQKLYYVYSSADIKTHLYRSYKDFNRDRLKAKVSNRVIAFGKGGELVGLDERKWMPAESPEGYSGGSATIASRPLGGNLDTSPAYILIYDGKVAMISLTAAHDPVGVIIEDQALYQTQRMIFEFNWSKL